MKLKILTWNIAWGYGMGSDGVGYRPMPQSHFESSLNSLSEFIRNLEIDIVLMQEVDFKSARSHDLSELDFIARKTDLLYHSNIVSWDKAYVPFPGILPGRHFGRINSGGGIISRYPIKLVECELLPKPKENSAAYNWFYLNRYLQTVEIEGLRFCNLHLEAFSPVNRKLHQDLLQLNLKNNAVDIAGGDFNGNIQLNADILNDFLPYPAPEPSFPSQAANEKLDGFIIRKNRFSNVSVRTLNSGLVSDHFPLLLELDFEAAPGFK